MKQNLMILLQTKQKRCTTLMANTTCDNSTGVH